MALKRKSQAVTERRVRPRRDEDSDVDDSDSQQDVPANYDSESEGPSDQSDREEQDDDYVDESDQEEEEAQPKVDLSSVSFGALARAQAALPSSRKSKSKSKIESSTSSEPQNSRLEKKEKRGDKSVKISSRSSKHAPQEQTSKKPVSRRREILADPRRKFRDPRFDPTIGGKIDEDKARKAYSFLDDYRDSELADMKVQMKKSKNYDEKEDLKRQIMSIESKKKARVRKDEENRLLNEHRKKEKDMVAQGKTPFYLKKSEQKKQLLTNRFEKMSKGQVDRAIERKRKKVAGKEKKELDFLTRRRG